jgi:hypothetical protein
VSGEPRSTRLSGSGAVALLLAAAAIVAAIVAARASFISSAASGSWQSAVRTEVKRAAAAVEDIRFLYQSEAGPAFAIAKSRLLEDELRKAAAAQQGPVHDALLREADVQAGVISALLPASELASGPAYALSSGGFDLGGRIADLRASAPDLVALDPDSIQAAGDRSAGEGVRLTGAAIPISIAVLFGALAQSFVTRRRDLLIAGWIALAIGAGWAITVELLA